MRFGESPITRDQTDVFNEEQVQFRAMVSRFLAAKCDTTAVRTLMASESGHDSNVWRQLCSELGLAGTHIPEAYGGFGFGAVELGIALEEMGRALYGGPFFASSVMATYALLLAGDETAKAELLPALADGSQLAALVLDDLDTPQAVGSHVTAAGGRLDGTARLVLNAQNASWFLVLAREAREAREAGDLALYRVPGDAAGVSVTAVEGLDATRKLAAVQFAGAAGRKVGSVSVDALARLWDHLCVALAHEMIGGAEHLLFSTIDYTKARYQFGRPIGSFQGLKHRCADLLLEFELAKAATHDAARCLDSGSGEPYAASMAKAMASDVYMHAAREAIQLRGGIGFTWEDDTHLWYKRAKSSEVFLGTPSFHRERMMALMEATEAHA